MSLAKLPKIEALTGQRWHLREDAIDKWNPSIQMADNSDNSISILDVIGEDYYTEGVTSKRISAALRQIGNNDVTVNINSPGGDFFEGVAIYNALRAHPAKVTVKVIGQATSAASVIAMAGDDIQIGKAGFMMIHNAWTIAIGNRHDLTSLADTMATFDGSMAEVYAAKSGQDKKQTTKWMDAETWFSGTEAIEAGLANGYLPSDEISQKSSDNTKNLKARTLMDGALRAQYPDMSRKERLELLNETKDPTPSAGGHNKPSAVEEVKALESVLETLRAQTST